MCSIDAEGRPSVAQGTLRVINDRREREERLVYLGSHDELTGQLNRTRLTEELTRFLGSIGQNPATGAFLLAGVNDLTLVNETYGYDVGDEVITIVGRRMGRALARQGLHRPIFVEQVRHRAAGLRARRGSRRSPAA